MAHSWCGIGWQTEAEIFVSFFFFVKACIHLLSFSSCSIRWRIHPFFFFLTFFSRLSVDPLNNRIILFMTIVWSYWHAQHSTDEQGSREEIAKANVSRVISDSVTLFIRLLIHSFIAWSCIYKNSSFPSDSISFCGSFFSFLLMFAHFTHHDRQVTLRSPSLIWVWLHHDRVIGFTPAKRRDRRSIWWWTSWCLTFAAQGFLTDEFL